MTVPSDDFSYVGADGQFSGDRAAFIGILTKAEASISDERVTIDGTTGVATGQFTVKDSTGVFTTRYTNVFAKGNDGWKSVAVQETEAKK